ncbi:CLUMA_CG009365, isoform A [Clunio marinus]|uniref:CLUMA_CG009365, isoform A n=1 Tax=Clunio marinus TaxID=568069 RepID=A0A1J1I6H6_9DIPT|nr:CLUMA_CG009365, isoform A [Clunio marinus]
MSLKCLDFDVDLDIWNYLCHKSKQSLRIGNGINSQLHNQISRTLLKDVKTITRNVTSLFNSGLGRLNLYVNEPINVVSIN